MRRTAPVILLFLLPFFFYWKLFAFDPTDRKIFRGDFMNQHYPWKSYASNRLSQKDLPLWNPHVRAGVPFHANPQVGLFYPPNYLLIPFLDDGKLEYRALEGFQILHQGLAGLGMLLLLLSLGVAPTAAWAGALVTLFTGFFTTPGHHAIVLTGGWIPLVLYLIKRAMDKAGSPSVVLVAISISWMMLAGHPQVAFYGLLLSAAWALYLGNLRGAATRFLPAAVLGAGLTAIQFLPTYELARQSTREGAGYEYSTSLAFSPSFLGGMLAPRGQVPLPGQDPSMPLHIYVGIGTLFLAAVGIAASKRRVRWFFASVALASLLLAFGKESFLYDLAYLAVPGFSRFRIPFRLLGLYSVAMAGLAALGLEVLMPIRGLLRRRVLTILWAFLGLFLVLGFWNAYLHWGLSHAPGAMRPRDVERMISGAHWALFLFAANAVLVSISLWRPARRWPAYAMVGLLSIDLGSFVYDRGIHPYRSLARTEERRVTRILKAQGIRGRFTHPTRPQGSYSMIHGVDYAGGQDSLVEEHYASLLRRGRESTNVLSLLNVKLVDRATRNWENAWCGPRLTSPLPLLDITAEISPVSLELLEDDSVSRLVLHWSPLTPGGEAGVRIEERELYLRESAPLELEFSPPQPIGSLEICVEEGNPGVRLQDIELDGRSIKELTDFLHLGNRIRLNLQSMPRAFFLTRCSEAKSVDSLSCWTLEDGAVLELCEDGVDGSGIGAVQISSYEPEEVVLEADLPRAGYVILADSFYPGWYAELDLKPVPVLRAQHALRAVAVPSGEHRIRFIYRPNSFYLGLSISLLSALILAAMAVRSCRPLP